MPRNFFRGPSTKRTPSSPNNLQMAPATAPHPNEQQAVGQRSNVAQATDAITDAQRPVGYPTDSKLEETVVTPATPNHPTHHCGRNSQPALTIGERCHISSPEHGPLPATPTGANRPDAPAPASHLRGDGQGSPAISVHAATLPMGAMTNSHLTPHTGENGGRKQDREVERDINGNVQQ
jgi:hypothetical protein